MLDTWKDQQFAKKYTENANNTDTNWYEHYVNAPAFWKMIPQGAHTVLDFGCGPADFTPQLTKLGYEVTGCDGSEAMIDLARKQDPSTHYFVWDGASPCPETKKYDAVVSKLTLHFVEDLALLAKNISDILQPGGSFIFSVPHPMSTIEKTQSEYFTTTPYDTVIGSYGIGVTMIHRSIQDYIKPFLVAGYAVTAIDEPTIPQDIIEKFAVKPEYARVPRRLNIAFKKVTA